MIEHLVTDEFSRETFRPTLHPKEVCLMFDSVSETLRHIYSPSKIKRKLSRILSTFYRYPILIIILSYFIGFLIICLPFILIYYSVISNIIIPFLIICFTSIFIFLLLIIIKIIDDCKNKLSLIAKWERKNILKNIGSFITTLFLLVPAWCAYIFYADIIIERNNEIIIDYNNTSLLEVNQTYLFFDYTLIMICLNTSEINDDNENNTTIYLFKNGNEREKIQKLLNCMNYFLIFLLILCAIKLIKIIFLTVKFYIQQTLFYLGSLSLFVMLIINNDYYPNLPYNFSSYIEIFSIILIYIGYLSWTFQYMFKFYARPKDKSFGIRKYYYFNFVIIIFNDIATCIGISLIFISILMYFLAYIKNEETFNNLRIIYYLFKIGFFILIAGNAYYYGHYILAMIFRPIALEYCPGELRNSYYIKAKNNLKSFLRKRKTGIKMKNILPKD